MVRTKNLVIAYKLITKKYLESVSFFESRKVNCFVVNNESEPVSSAECAV